MTTPLVASPTFQVASLNENLVNTTVQLNLANPPAGTAAPGPMPGSPNGMTIQCTAGMFDFGLQVGKTYSVAFTEVVTP